jgi:phosphoribosylaminoimidazole (AIR) synthetase
MVEKSWQYCRWCLLIDIDELARTFNCGIGMVLVVDVDNVHKIKQKLNSMGENVYEIGTIVPLAETRVKINNSDDWNKY